MSTSNPQPPTAPENNDLPRLNHAEELALDKSFADLASEVTIPEVTFSPKEQQILELWTELQEQRVENALLEAWKALEEPAEPAAPPINANAPDASADVEAQIKAAEKAHLDARAAWCLQRSIVQDVLIADPVLKAVHRDGSGGQGRGEGGGEGRGASGVAEGTLAPLLATRDVLSLAQTALSARLSHITSLTIQYRTKTRTLTTQNQALAKELLELTGQLEKQSAPENLSEEGNAQLEEARAKTREARRRWRIVKGVASAVVAGSGFDWSGDPELRELVLDEE